MVLIILIYESTETNFDHLGLGGLNPFSCSVREELNGQFELSMEHPIDENGKWEKLENERILKAPTHRGDQLFRIYFCNPNPKTGYITVNARHIFYDLMDNFIEDTRPTLDDGETAGQEILDGCQYEHSFLFTSDIEDVSTAYYIRVNPVQALIGNIDQAFINRWGGEIERDNFNIAINSRIGADNGVRIAYGKNLTGFSMTLDKTNVITRIMPTALDQNGAVLLTDAKYYDSPLINNYPHPKIGTLNTNIRVGQEVDGTVLYADEASAKTAMAAMAQAAFDNGVDEPSMTLNVSFVRWQDTEEYKNFAVLHTVELGDDIAVEYQPLNVDVNMRVVAIEWDCLKNKSINLTIGNKEPNFAKTVVDLGIDVSTLQDTVNSTLREGEVYNNVTITHEEGVVTSATIGGVLVEVKQNAQDGFALYADGAYVGGLKVIDGKAVLVSNMLTNEVNGNCYAEIGNWVDGGTTYRGIFIFNKNYSEEIPTAKILASYFGSVDIIAGSGYCRLTLDSNGNFISITDNSNHVRLSLIETAASLSTNDGAVFISNENYAEIKLHGSPSKSLGIDSTGFYKNVNGTKTYF